MGDGSALDELIRRASDPAVSSEALNAAMGPAFSSFSSNDREGTSAAVRRLAEEVVDAPTRPDVAGIIALCCGAFVERGIDPTIAIDMILDRIERQIAPDAIAFVAACRQAAEDEPLPSPVEGVGADHGGQEPEQPDPVELHQERIAALMPTEGRSYQALEPFSLAAIAMLARSADARKASCSRTALRNALDELGGQYGYAGLLWMMLQVLDDEPVVVLHPEQGKGYKIRISGLGDNFQLHTLLADALIGRFSKSWLRGRRPRRVEVTTARDGPVRENSPPAFGSFNLWTWRGLGPDGRLRDLMSSSAHWIWNEGVPSDIPLFEGTRVVLLGPPPYERSWNAVRKFPAMAGDLRVEQILTAEETRAYLRRIARAVALECVPEPGA